MNENLEKLNNAARDAADASFLDCCGAREWARQMTDARPFTGENDLLERAAGIWRNLDEKDWLEAFAAHPKIGSRRAAPSQKARAAAWSRGEQSGIGNANEAVLDELAAVNRLYEEKFGYIFIVCATGKTAAEMLSMCRARLGNDHAAEIKNAAGEQQKITEIRLKKLLGAEI